MKVAELKEGGARGARRERVGQQGVAAAPTARGDPVQAVEARAPRARAAGVGREGEGAGCVRSGRQRREERLGLVNERWQMPIFYRFEAPTATFTALNKV